MLDEQRLMQLYTISARSTYWITNKTNYIVSTHNTVVVCGWACKVGTPTSVNIGSWLMLSIHAHTYVRSNNGQWQGVLTTYVGLCQLTYENHCGRNFLPLLIVATRMLSINQVPSCCVHCSMSLCNITAYLPSLAHERIFNHVTLLSTTWS